MHTKTANSNGTVENGVELLHTDLPLDKNAALDSSGLADISWLTRRTTADHYCPPGPVENSEIWNAAAGNVKRYKQRTFAKDERWSSSRLTTACSKALPQR
mmetsp:Transcript_37426/g.149327  ORF Transcript_37426/g.149327 Transcript_37426/m.149327 type:complete len:101 (-) Transcript_37426:1937-2239(-)